MTAENTRHEEIIASWEAEGQYADWYAVDNYNPNTMQTKRVFVGTLAEADRFAQRMTAPSDTALSPFYRCQLIDTADALRFFQGDQSVAREDGFLSVTEAADRLGVSRARVHQLIGSGKLEAERVGATMMVYEASVNARMA